MDESQEQELMEMEKALTTPEEANNTEETKEETTDESKETEEESQDESEETEEESEEESEDEEAPRNPKVPYKKFKAEREKRKTLESELSSLKADVEAIKNSKMSATDQKDEIEKLAEEYGVDPAFAKRLSENIKNSIKSPISEEELEMLRDTKIEKEQNEKFESEFKELLEVNPEAKEHKKKLREMAFDKKYSGKNFKPLYYIFSKEIKSVTKSKTAESSSPKKNDSTVIDYENLEEKEALKLSPDKFLEWAEYQSRK